MTSGRMQAAERRYLVLGAGGHAMSVADVIEAGGARVELFSGDPLGQPVTAEVVDDDDTALRRAEATGLAIALGVGSNTVRLRLLDAVPVHLNVQAVLAPTATVAATATVGAGTVIHHHAHVGPRASIGRAVIINTGVIVEHDCRVGDGAHIAPGAVLLGAATVGEGAFVGSGARILPGVSVGEGGIVGAGAVVTRNVPARSVAVGVPAEVKRAL